MKSNKNDAADAEAICEAMSRPGMRFVAIKTVEQQDIQAMHRVRSGLVSDRNVLNNRIRGLVAEYGLVTPRALSSLKRAIPDWLEDANNGLTDCFRTLLNGLWEDLKRLNQRIAELDKKIAAIKDLKDRKERLLQRIATIQKLQTNRTEIVHLFDETVRRLPDGVYLKSLKQSGSNITMTGVAESNTRVSKLIRNIEASEWMTDPKIDVIRRNKGSALQTNDFTVQLKQSRPKSSQQEGEGES